MWFRKTESWDWMNTNISLFLSLLISPTDSNGFSPPSSFFPENPTPSRFQAVVDRWPFRYCQRHSMSRWCNRYNRPDINLPTEIWPAHCFVGSPYIFKLDLSPQKEKRIALSSGAMALSYLALGLLSKTNHYPGGDIMIILSAMIFAVGCMPFAAKYLFEKE